MVLSGPFAPIREYSETVVVVVEGKEESLEEVSVVVKFCLDR